MLYFWSYTEIHKALIDSEVPVKICAIDMGTYWVQHHKNRT